MPGWQGSLARLLPPKSPHKFGLDVATLTGELAERHGYAKSTRGVLITDVAEGSDAAEQGLRPSMVITKVRDKAVVTAEQFAQAIGAEEAASGVRLNVITPDGGRRFVFITPNK